MHVVEEVKKVALVHDLLTACYVSLLHVVPITASVTLMVLNLRGFYIGGDLSGANGSEGTSIRLLILQFLSKALELLAVASLSSILFALIRHSLIHDDLPYGAITTGFEFTKISLLWSKEFVATCSTAFSSRGSKFLFIATSIVFTFLGASLGPSFATTLQPTLQDFNGGGTSFYLPTGLWPLNLEKMDPSDVACSSSSTDSCFLSNSHLISDELLSYWPTSWPQTDDYNLPQVMPEQTLIAGRHALRELAIRFRGPFIYQPDLTVATTPSAVVAETVASLAKYWTITQTATCAVGKPAFCFYKNIVFSVEAFQPVAFVKCNPNSVNSTLKFSRIDQGTGSFPLLDFDNITFPTQDWYSKTTNNSSDPSLTWVELPQAKFGLSSIGAVVALPWRNGSNPTIFSCTADARWANSTATSSFTGGPKVVRGEPNKWFTTSRLQKSSNGKLKWPLININPLWADSLDSVLDGFNGIGRLGNVALAPYSVNAVEATLAVMLAEGLSRVSSSGKIQGSLKGTAKNEWMSQMLPDRSVFGTGGSAFNYSFRSGDPFQRFEMKTTVNGYGYGITTATILSSIVLLLYSAIAMLFIVYSTCFARSTSSAWESISEVIALAMKSTPAAALHNTGAGIHCLKTLKEKIRIRVNDDKQLQMVFLGEDTDEREYLKRVTPNESYG